MKKFSGEHGGDDHRKYIHQRALKGCNWEEGQFATMKRNRVQIMGIEKDFDKVQWAGLSPLIVEVWIPGTDEFYVIHPNDLRKAR